MKQCYDIALWMFVLIGTLQAMPTYSPTTKPACDQTLPSFDVTDMGLPYLKTLVKCGPNVTFITPKNQQPICHAAALEVFIKGLEQASQNCTDRYSRAGGLLEHIRDIYPGNTECQHPAQCTWDIETFGKQYEEFLDTLESFLTNLNN